MTSTARRGEGRWSGPLHQSFSTRLVWVGNDIEVVVFNGVSELEKKKGGRDEAQGDETRGYM